MTFTSASTLTLAVANPMALQHGSAPRFKFDTAGGTIGCRGANWVLTDQQDRIQPIHCEIAVIDGAFCVVDRSGQTRINGSDMPIGQNASVRLAEGNVLHIGPYKVNVHLQAPEDYVLPDPTRDLGQHNVGELVNAPLESLDVSAPVLLDQLAQTEKAALDPLLALGQTISSRDDLDPLRALEKAESHGRLSALPSDSLLDPRHMGLSTAPVRPDFAATRFEAVSDSPTSRYGEHAMTLPTDYLTSGHTITPTANVEAGSLSRGLGADLDLAAPHDAQRILLEAGQALQAALRGIAALYGQPSDSDAHQHLSMLRRTLQPIEDNPLRLGLDYPDMVNALFGSQRSLVHLSPRAAIDESLTQARQHNIAVVKAISASLDALLRAFSPDVLLQRFERYRSGQGAQTKASDWAWEMYTHYYNELASSRQQGFEKLFWEVFEQAYDRALREAAQ